MMKLAQLRLVGSLLALTIAGAAVAEPVPAIRTTGAGSQLIVDGKPWIALAGEVHNSTASSAAYMAPIWDRLASMNLNTVVSPTYWELIEPKEGRLDFALVDEQLRQARAHKLRLVLLWFGSIKNAKSTYAPAWVLADRIRFPRAAIRPSKLPFAKGEPPISVFSQAARTADTRAFAKLMEHLAIVDPQHTVIAVQVENETGILGDARDRSPEAERAWNAPVPPALLASLEQRKGRLAPSLELAWSRNGRHRQGSWAEVFGTDATAEELFMAWGTARLVEQVAAAGKAKLALPLYANAWIGPQRPDEAPGVYPSGGPVPRVFDIWHATAPSLSWLSPDVYVDEFTDWAGAYTKPGNPLFVPEARFIVGNLFVALGRFSAIGFSPFGIEAGVPGNQISDAYRLLSGAIPVVADAQVRGAISGFALAKGDTHKVTLGSYTVTVQGQREAVSRMLLDMGISIPAPAAETKPQNIGDHASEMTDTRPMGLVMQIASDEFLVVGKDLAVSFAPVARPDAPAEIAQIEEGTYVDGRWLPGRVLNGDERLRIVPADSFGMVKVRLLRARDR